MVTSYLLHATGHPPDPRSFPTRRSSDLASTSACVITWLAVQVIVPPGARSATGLLGWQLLNVASASVTSTLCSVTLPALDASPVQALVRPASWYVPGPAVFVIDSCAICT